MSFQLPLPRLTQPWMVPFPVWQDRYGYFVDCVLENLRCSLAHVPSLVQNSVSHPVPPGTVVEFDWDAMRRSLERYLYRTGHSRFRSFCYLGGPRNGPVP